MYPRTFSGWLQRLLILVSQTVNALVLMGNPDETVSARAYRTPWPRTRRILDTIFFWEPEHCFRSHQRDIEFARKLLQQQHTQVTTAMSGEEESMNFLKRIWIWIKNLFGFGGDNKSIPVPKPDPAPRPKPERKPEREPEPSPEPDPEPRPEPQPKEVFYDFYDENQDGVIDYGKHRGRRYDIHSKKLTFLD